MMKLAITETNGKRTVYDIKTTDELPDLDKRCRSCYRLTRPSLRFTAIQTCAACFRKYSLENKLNRRRDRVLRRVGLYRATK